MKSGICFLLTLLFFVVGAFIFKPLNALSYSSETLTAEKGVFRLLSAEQPDQGDYHLRTSLQYFQQGGLLKDTADSTIESTKATMAFGYAFKEYFLASFSTGFHFSSRTPENTQTGSQSIANNLVRASLSTTGFYDLGVRMGLKEKRLLTALNLWIDFSKISRFIKGFDLVPKLIVSSDFTDNDAVPFRLHSNFGFHPGNGGRYFDKATAVTDFDRFSTNTFNSWAVSAAAGIELPFKFVDPSLEIHLMKLSNANFSSTPKWLTIGLKGRPFNQKNIEIFGGADIGLSSYKNTALGSKPENPAVPLWNMILGFGISKFGLKEGQIPVNEVELQGLKRRVEESEATLRAIKNDIDYNVVQGRVFDAVSKDRLGDVEISFPEAPDLKSFKTDSLGNFLRYFRSLTAARMVFSKDGYEPSSKFLTLKPGEKLAVDIELRREVPGLALSEFIATLLNESGEPILASVTFKKSDADEAVSGQSDQNGQVYLKVPVGDYNLLIEADGFSSIEEKMSFEKGKTVLRSYTMTRKP